MKERLPDWAVIVAVTLTLWLIVFAVQLVAHHLLARPCP